jgi:hypothetical protein
MASSPQGGGAFLYIDFACKVYFRYTFMRETFRPFSQLVGRLLNRHVFLLPGRRRLPRERQVSGGITDLE